MAWLFFLLAIPGMLYLLLQIYISSSWVVQSEVSFLDHENLVHAPPTTRVSILIAARNEARNINRCLESLRNQQYPRGLMEILVINDHSSDLTSEIARSFEPGLIQVFELPDGRCGKKEAIQFGISFAKGDVLLFTDADCEVPPGWLYGMTEHMLIQKADLVCGPVGIHMGASTWLEEFQQIDFAGTMAVTSAAIKSGYFVLANGANLGIRSSFLEENRIDWNMKFASGDDMTLAGHVVSKGGKATFILSREALVRTRPCQNLNDFVKQRIRWGTKNKSTSQRKMLIPVGIVYVTSVFSFLFLLILVVTLTGVPGGYATYFVIPFILKIMGDLMLAGGIHSFFNLNAGPLKVLLYSIVHSVYLTLVGTGSLLIKHYSWKGRKVR